jgi:hypothetical protein
MDFRSGERRKAATTRDVSREVERSEDRSVCVGTIRLMTIATTAAVSTRTTATFSAPAAPNRRAAQPAMKPPGMPPRSPPALMNANSRRACRA